jgi:hypothetical protein
MQVYEHKLPAIEIEGLMSSECDRASELVTISSEDMNGSKVVNTRDRV